MVPFIACIKINFQLSKPQGNFPWGLENGVRLITLLKLA